MEFRDKIAIVTGASSGIGHATARALAQRGATVVAVARREDALRALIEQCREHAPRSCHIVADLSEREQAEGVVSEAVARFGRLDILINNAARPVRKSIYAIDVAEVEVDFRVNFFSCLWTTFAAIPHFLNAGGGTIVNVSSFASKVVPTYESIYAATKSAMNGFSEGLWNDLAGSNIHVSLVHPGPIDTEIWGKGEQSHSYKGPLYPPEQVALGIIEAIEKKRHEVILPRHNPQLMTARFLRFAFPSLLRAGVARMDPADPAHLEQARLRARGLAPPQSRSAESAKSDASSDERDEPR